MKTVYLSGPIGDMLFDSKANIRERRKEFARYESKIRRAGYDVINPFTVADAQMKGEKTSTREELMRVDIIVLAQKADEVWLMPGWEESRGCDAEVHVALALGMPVFDMERRKMITLSKTGMQALIRPLCGKIATDVEKMRIYD